MPTVLFTGFPGFLASALMPRVMARLTDHTAVCLVEPRMLATARRRAEHLEAVRPDLAGRIRLVEGDITRPDLGLGGVAPSLAADTAEIHHLAAVYDLAVARDLGLRVNVAGTRHVLDLAERCPGLRRLHYVSTCYVSGRWAGPWAETDLERGQVFNNHYEETKFLAEVEVRARMAGGLPATVYRPSVVVGDSATGATQKYDGPYYVIRWLLKQPRVAVLPVVGDPTATRLNVVPSDFVVAAIDHLAGLEDTRGRTYQLADPRPPTVDQAITVLGRATGRRIVRVPVGAGLAKGAIAHVPGLAALMEMPAQAVDYFRHPTHYLTERTTADLAGTGIEAPPFRSYAPALAEFVRQHPRLRAA